MTKKVLIAGATGHLGRSVIRKLRERGHRVRAVVRDAQRLGDTRDLIDEVVVGDFATTALYERACEGVEVVFSCLGSPINLAPAAQRTSHHDVDYAVNKKLLDASLRVGVGRFVYVSLYGAEKLARLAYVRAHEDVVAELERSGIDHAVVRPTGFFYSLAELVKLARFPAMTLIGNGEHRTNPIHEDDLAGVCVDAVEGDRREYPAGGPQVYTRREINELAFAALGKKPRMVKVPPAVMKAGLRIVRPFDRRLYELLLFLISISQVDCVAPAAGARRLDDYYAAFAKTLTRLSER